MSNGILWVIESKFTGSTEWEYYDSCESRKDARELKKDYKRWNLSTDKFRIRKYIREEE